MTVCPFFGGIYSSTLTNVRALIGLALGLGMEVRNLADRVSESMALSMYLTLASTVSIGERKNDLELLADLDLARRRAR